MEIKDAIEQIFRGKAVLFTGAGFSIGATNQLEDARNSIPTAQGFADFLSEDLVEKGFSDQGKGHALQIISDYYCQEAGENQLVKALIDQFSVRDVTDTQKEIAKLPWRRVYTTNYDNVFEFAARRVGINWTPITTTTGISGAKNRVVHINGHINDLTINSLQDQVKLTHSSYSASDFGASKWSQQLRQDFDNASAIFFIGYSLYDIEISRILFDSDLKRRTFFIVWEHEKDIGIASAKRHGTVLKIGADGFANLVRNAPKNLEPEPYSLTWLRQYKKPEKLVAPTDDDTTDLLTLGVINSKALVYDLSSDNSRYVVKRSAVETVFTQLQNGRTHFVIHSDLGNGKTILKHQLSQKLSVEGYTVFWDGGKALNIRSDLRQLEKSSRKVAIFLDDYPDKIEILKILSTLDISDLTVFVLTRTIRYELGQTRFDDTLPENYAAIDINQLTEEDVESLIDIMETLGLWQDIQDFGRPEKIGYISKEYKNNLSKVILSRFEKSEIGQRISDQIRDNLQDNQFSRLLILTFVFDFLGLQSSTHYLDEILEQNSKRRLYDPKFSNSGEFIRVSGSKIVSRSSILAEYILNNVIDADTLVMALESFAWRLAEIKRDHVLNELFKQLLRFPSIEKMLTRSKTSKDERGRVIISYFQSLREITYCKRNASFWLHFAMARLNVSDFKNAKLHFSAAKGIAKSASEKRDIENHYARYLIQSRTESDEFDDYFEAFQEAHQILLQQMNRTEIHHNPFRQAFRYLEFISFRRNKLSTDQIKAFALACRQVLSSIDNINASSQLARSSVVLECKSNMEKCLEKTQ